MACLPPAGVAAASGPGDFAPTLRVEAAKAGLPFDLADALMAIESSYDPGRVGTVGEIGLMQVRPATAAMLGFKGSAAELARPEVNMHYGVAYLAGAWKQAGGDLCRALMKYRAGHGSEVITPLSATYCRRARAHLLERGSVFAAMIPATLEGTGPASPGRTTRGRSALIGMRGDAFWAMHKARIARINASIERRWRRLAAR